MRGLGAGRSCEGEGVVVRVGAACGREEEEEGIWNVAEEMGL